MHYALCIMHCAPRYSSVQQKGKAMTKKIMIVGVGGQGTLLASRILGNTVIGEGYDVKVSEVHGMSQRGGSVVTYVKYGEKVYSPIIDKGEADIILAFEMLVIVVVIDLKLFTIIDPRALPVLFGSHHWCRPHFQRKWLWHGGSG